MSSIIELSDIKEYNAKDFTDPVEIVDKDKDFRNQKNKEPVIDLTNDHLSNKPSLKRKLSPSTNRKSSKKSKEEPLENEKTEILELEIEEKKIALREH
ncbi:6078_t:CDS:2 [Rhizophagus irregularis]|nr:6078_t:CDS:2 [Rhizophagus irregularis]